MLRNYKGNEAELYAKICKKYNIQQNPNLKEQLAAAEQIPEKLQNEDGLPVRTGKEACLYYLNTGACGSATQCILQHPPKCARENEPKLAAAAEKKPLLTFLSNFDSPTEVTRTAMQTFVFKPYGTEQVTPFA